MQLARTDALLEDPLVGVRPLVEGDVALPADAGPVLVELDLPGAERALGGAPTFTRDSFTVRPSRSR
jgi:hypothetical protein